MTTIRQQIIAILEQGPCDARDLSQELSISEKEVYAHLPHVGKSVAPQGKKLRIDPARCLACGFVFGSRKRVTRPGRCPQCKNQRIQSPRFEVK
ncbi:MAG: ArsR family transcriptional regulator [Desulfobacterales bacterium]|nr:ArsR family transcriptional regulator [Desulfobacterales bacterium]